MCFNKLGMSDGTIFDFQITGSSWISEYEPVLARPGFSGWCADLLEPNPYIQVRTCTSKNIIFRVLFHNLPNMGNYLMLFEISTVTWYFTSNLLSRDLGMRVE